MPSRFAIDKILKSYFAQAIMCATFGLSLCAALCVNTALCPSTAFADNEASIASQGPLENAVSKLLSYAKPILAIQPDAMFACHYYWDVVENVDFGSANEDGSLSEWQAGWYISHDWSYYGQEIAAFEPGDAVTLDGFTVLILGRDEWPKGSINWDIYDVIGWDKIVFQTCFGDDAIWIAYGYIVYPNEEFLAAHG